MNTPTTASTLHKVLAFGLAISVVVWTFGVLLVIPAQAVDQHPNGSLVLSGSTVFKVMDGQRLGFSSANTFLSHGYGWGQIVNANSADLALPQGANLAFADGALVNDGGTVFVTSNGQKLGFTSAAVFTGLGYSFANVVNEALPSLPQGANLDSTTMQHPAGTLVNSNGTIWYITPTGRAGIPTLAVFNSRGFDFADVVPANAADLALAAEANLGYRVGTLINDGGTVWALTSSTEKRGFPSASCFTDFGFNFANVINGSTSGITAGSNLCDGTTPPTTPPTSSTGTLVVSLASNTPASGTVVQGAARVPFTRVNLTASGGDVVVDSMTIQRGGLGQDSAFSEIVFVNGGTNAQIGLPKTLSSNHQATLNDDVTVKNGETVSVVLAGNMAADLSGNVGETPSLGLVGITLTGSASLSASLPIYGNTMNLNSSITIGTVTIQPGALEPAASTQNIGTANYIFSEIKITVGSQEDMQVEQITFTQVGTADISDLTKIELVENGVVVASNPTISGDRLTFNLVTPITILKGNNKSFAIRATIEGGSNRNIDFDVDRQSDVLVKGKTYGFYKLPTFQTSAAVTISTDPRYNGVVTTIGTGSLKVEPAAGFPSSNVSEGSADVTLGAFDLTAKGEAVQVTKIGIQTKLVTSGSATTSDITNVRLVDPNGVTVAGPVDPTYDFGSALTSYGTATSTDTITVPVGTTRYTVIATLSNDFSSDDTIVVQITPAANITAKGAETGKTITATPATVQASATMTVKAGALSVSVSPQPVAQTVIAGASQFTFAKIVLDAQSSGEDLRMTSFSVAIHTTTANPADVSTFKAFIGGEELVTSNDPDPTSSTAGASATSTFTLVSPKTLTKGTSVEIEIRGNISSAASSGTYKVGFQSGNTVVVTGLNTGTTITPTYSLSDGSAMTLNGSGTLTLSKDASSPVEGLLVGNQTGQSVGVLNAEAKFENVKIEKVWLNITAVNGGGPDQVTKVYLYDGATLKGSATPTSTDSSAPVAVLLDMTGTPVDLTANVAKKLTVKVDTACVTTSGCNGQAGQGFAVKVGASSDVTAKGVSSGSTLASSAITGPAITFNNFSIYNTVPTFALVNLPTNTLSNGTKVLSKFSITADAKGDVGFAKAVTNIATTTANITLNSLALYEVSVAGVVNETALQTAVTATLQTNNELQAVFGSFNPASLGKEFRQIAAGTTNVYEVRGNVTGSASGASVSTAVIGDGTVNTTVANQNFDQVNTAQYNNFIWSDLHFGNSSTTATTTKQWFNGYKVPGLLATSTAQTMSQ